MTKKEFEYWKKHPDLFYGNCAIYVNLHKPMLLHNVYVQKRHELRYEDETSTLFTPNAVVDINFDNDAITFTTRVKEYYFELHPTRIKHRLIGGTLVNVIPRKIIKSIDIIHYDW
jgi:hypothetical protein